MVVFIGAQASGKSTFFKSHYADSHVRINLDMLGTRSREALLIKACLEARQSFVVDGTNPTVLERKRYFTLAGGFDVRAVGIYFQSSINLCIARNRGRAGKFEIPDHAIAATIAKLELPSWHEGFDELQFVRINDGRFSVEEWKS